MAEQLVEPADFLTAIYQGTPGFIGFMFLHRPTGRVETKQFPTSQVQDAVALCESKDKEGYDVYFSPAVMQEIKTTIRVSGRDIVRRGKKSDFTGSRCLWVDLDAKGGLDKATLQGRLRDFVPQPSIVVDSGNGLHAYWILDHFVDDALAVERRNLWLANQLGADHCHSIDHVLRVPGTHNHKNEVKQ